MPATRKSPARGLTSERLTFRRLRATDVDAFHLLVTDPHIRRFMMDGQTMAREWTQRAVAASDDLFETHGVGLWLVFEMVDTQRTVGFCGFRVFDALGDEPKLLYAFPEPQTGKGFATEVARALVEYASRAAGFAEVCAAVDRPNRASIRVLEKVGFRRDGEVPGAFVRTLLFTWRRGGGHGQGSDQ